LLFLRADNDVAADDYAGKTQRAAEDLVTLADAAWYRGTV
jgi:hypothetical protein